MKKNLIITDFQAGIGTLGQKRDKPGSARFIKNLDPYEDQDYITLSRATTKISSTTVTGLLTWLDDASPWSTDRYACDDSGTLYKITSSDVVSLIRSVSNSSGQGLKIFDDYAYYITDVDIGRYGRLSGTPAFNDSLTSWWDAAISDIQDTGGGTGQTYATTTGINEGATHRQTFVAGKDPLKSIVIDINDTGDDPNWTVTVHDSEDNVIGSETIVFASVTTGDNTFTFDTPLRLTIGNTYHFHVTTTTTTGAPKVTTSVSSDLEGAEYVINYGVLIDADYHAAVVLEDQLVIANERYLASFDQATYDPNKIAFDAGFEVRTLIKTEEYVIAECFKGSSILDSEEGKRYYWDGIAPSFNFSEPISIGAPNAAVSYKGESVVGVYGFRGTLYDAKPEKEIIHEAPKLAKGKNIEVYPGAISMYEGHVLVGYAGSTDDTTGVELGVYEYGGQIDDTPKGLNLPYVISTGNTQATNLKIGVVKVIGKDIFIGWREGSSYGIDKVALGATAATSGLWESLIFDGGNPKKQELAIQLKGTFLPLASGQSIQLGYQLDRSGSFTLGTAESTVGATETELSIYSRFKEIEFKYIVASSGGTFPKFTSLIFNYDDLSNEGVE